MKKKEYYIRAILGGYSCLITSLILVYLIYLFNRLLSPERPMWIIPLLGAIIMALLFFAVGVIILICITYQLINPKLYHECRKCKYWFKKSEGPLCVTCKDKK